MSNTINNTLTLTSDMENNMDNYTVVTKDNVHALTDRDVMNGRVFVEIDVTGETREVDDLQEARYILAQYAVGMTDTPARTYTNPDPEGDRLAHVIECQLVMDKIMTVIEHINERIEKANSDSKYHIPYPKFKQLVSTRTRHWELWNRGKAAVAETIGEDKALWVKFFELKEQGELEDHLAEYLAKDINKYFTYNGSMVASDKVDSRHAPSEEIYKDTHIQEMKDYDAPATFNAGNLWNYAENQRIIAETNEKENEELYMEALLSSY